MDTIEAIRTRRSIRIYNSERISSTLVKNILEDGSFAPSGLNNQPWKFVVVEDKNVIESVSTKTKYSHIFVNAQFIICVYLDKSKSYHYIKDVQAIGACIQNILLSSHANGIGACWLGEILNKAKEVDILLNIPEEYELMAVITLGYPAEKKNNKDKKKIDDLIFKWIV